MFTTVQRHNLVCDILNTAEPGSQEQLVLERKIKALVCRVEGDELHGHLKALLDFRNGADNYWTENFKETA
jgi:hypothetical protein